MKEITELINDYCDRHKLNHENMKLELYTDFSGRFIDYWTYGEEKTIFEFNNYENFIQEVKL